MNGFHCYARLIDAVRKIRVRLYNVNPFSRFPSGCIENVLSDLFTDLNRLR